MTYNVSTGWIILFACLAIWDIAWKGAALWRAARSRQSAWFVILLIINSVGILPIIYLKLVNKESD